MPTPASATVVVVSRDRWSPTARTLEPLLRQMDPRHPVVVVSGGAPPSLDAHFDRLAAAGRIQVRRSERFLASNEARNVGAEGAHSEWVAFIENDCVPDDGWLEALIDCGERQGAASVFPAYLEERPAGVFVHGLGADLEISGPPGCHRVTERQHHLGRPWREVAGHVEPVARIQSEPHLVVIRREVLERMGGLDEGLMGWFEHVDLALEHRRLGLSSWLVPSVTCLYLPPPPVTPRDASSFALRWGVDWFDRSLQRLCTRWGLDRLDPGWDHHARYRMDVRQSVPTSSRRVNRILDRVLGPWEHRLAARWHRQRACGKAQIAGGPAGLGPDR